MYYYQLLGAKLAFVIVFEVSTEDAIQLTSYKILPDYAL